MKIGAQFSALENSAVKVNKSAGSPCSKTSSKAQQPRFNQTNLAFEVTAVRSEKVGDSHSEKRKDKQTNGQPVSAVSRCRSQICSIIV